MAVLLGSASCGNVVRQGRSPSFLVIDFLTAAAGVNASSFTGTLQSDVVTNVTKTINGLQVQVPTIFRTPGRSNSESC